MKSYEERVAEILEKATNLAENVKSWADFAAAMFSYQPGTIHNGIVAQLLDHEERLKFYNSKAAEPLNTIFLHVMKKFGVVEGSRRIDSIFITSKPAEKITLTDKPGISHEEFAQALGAEPAPPGYNPLNPLHRRNPPELKKPSELEALQAQVKSLENKIDAMHHLVLALLKKDD